LDRNVPSAITYPEKTDVYAKHKDALSRYRCVFPFRTYMAFNSRHMFIAALTSAVAFGSGALAAPPTEGQCLALAKVGGLVAELANTGMSEEEIKSVVLKVADNKDVTAKVILYIYTMRPSAEQGRKQVYLKCKAGDFYPLH
jgi:hypothetical protein